MTLEQLSGEHSLYCEALPDNGRDPLLLVHGFLSSQAQWLENLAGMASFARPVTVELPGHARSATLTNGGAFCLDALIDQLEAVRRSLGVSSWSVCGHSLGGAIALNYALRSPETVDRVIFTNSRSALEDPSQAPTAGPVDTLVEQLRNNGPATIRALPYHPSKMSGVSDTLKAALVADADLHGAEGLIALFAGALGEVNLRGSFGAIKAPVLLVNGVKERSFQPVRNWVEEFHPQVSIVDLDAGHSPNAELPEAFNAAIREFLVSD